LLPGGTREHPGVECIGAGLGDAVIPGMAGAGETATTMAAAVHPEALHEIPGAGGWFDV